MIYFLKVFGLSVLIGGIVIVLVSWYCHISMVRGNNKKWGWGNYATFIREFNKYNWKVTNSNKSLMDRDHDAEFHASIIEFNNIGMIMRSPIQWIRVCMFVRRYIKKSLGIKIKPVRYNWYDNSVDQCIVHLSEDDRRLIENVYNEVLKLKPTINYEDVQRHIIQNNFRRVK